MTAIKTAASALALGLGCSALMTGAAQAAGFYLQDLSARQAGSAFSGAATAQGPDALWWNPASIAGTTTKQLSFGAAYIAPKGTVNDTGSVIVRPGQAPASVGGNPSAKGPILNGVLPNVSFSMPLNDRVAVGLTVNAPYSFETHYTGDSWARYNAEKTRLTTVDIQPTIAFKLNNWLNVGVGINAEYTKATLGNKLPNLSPALPDGDQVLEGDGWDTGWSVGAQAHSGKLVAGLSYKSAIKHNLKGTVNISGLLGPLAASNMTQDGVTADFSTPSQLTAGLSYQATDRLALHGQVTNFGWSKFDAITLGAPFNQAIPEDYRDTTSVAVGFDYVIDPKWTVRAGVQTDPTPTRDGHRDARVPDSDRIDYAIGTTWQMTPAFAIDAAFTYVGFKKTQLDYTTAAYAGTAAQTPILINGAVNDAKATVFMLGGHYSF
ncbi:outer membrane protein transport protein [Asticcacaulis sp. EMRT-3]|uniref:OmpP1/FadL family transporter n=1 Tax=Asticcacaulis sp. EMRT-3 TaxID=3040349 RepID=UPI0024AF92F1|nr:outer membrane protein transport protein [Asticcacaulis sp. EMRT-3]MDI7775648.1 outer membrane protein transport protein [Asticcacaulis sp. EMRT-3]